MEINKVKIIFSIIAILGIMLVIWIILAIKDFDQAIKECYILEWAGGYVCSYHRDHGVFPSEWSDMKKYYVQSDRPPCSWKDFKKYVVIEFEKLNLYNKYLHEGSGYPDFIYLKSGRTCFFNSDGEPDKVILEYLRNIEENDTEKQ